VTTTTIAGHDVDMNDQGFLEKPEQWSRDIGNEDPKDAGIDPLTDRYWQVVEFMRDSYLKDDTAPSIRALGKTSGVPVKELNQLFKKGPAKLAARIAGIPTPPPASRPG